jgi:hypothetical protein
MMDSTAMQTTAERTHALRPGMPEVPSLDVPPVVALTLITVVAGGCWHFLGTHRKHDGRPVLANKYVYRLLYELVRGPIPKGHVAHHQRCDDKACVNPWHVEPMTQSQHMMEHGFGGDANVGQAAKTHCRNGHEYNVANTYAYKRHGRNERHCRTCARNHMRDARRAARAMTLLPLE